MKLWIDDVRPMPEGYTHWAKTAEEAISILCDVFCPVVETISFDHDLGGEFTGYDVALYIEKASYEGTFWRCNWDIHSANPVGRKRIRQAMESAERFWRKEEKGV